MKILWVGRKFDGVAGGVERMSIQIMNALVHKGQELHLLTWDQVGARSFYPLNPAIEWHMLNLGNPMEKASWSTRIRRQFRIRAIVKSVNPKVIVAFQHGAFLAVRLATIGTGVPVIAAERNAPQRFDYIRIGKFRNLIFLSFLLAAKVTIQFEGYRKEYPRYLHKRLIHIPNPVDLAQTRNASLFTSLPKRNFVLFVGHFEFQKNPMVLLEAFKIIAPEFPNWDLQLVGEGSMRSEMAAFVATNNLQDRVHFLGVHRNMEKVYLSSQIFCLPSRWEGFPNALAEALAYGLPSVGFKEAAGINQLINDQNNGLLAEGNEDPTSLGMALALLMKDTDLRIHMGKKAPDSVRKYSKSKVHNAWFNLIEQVKK